MSPRPSLQSLHAMAASTAGGDSCRLLPAIAAGAHRIRLLHSFTGRRRLSGGHEVACCVRCGPASRPAGSVAICSRSVHSMEDYRKKCEERLRQLTEKLKKEGICPKQWRLGTFQRMMCPMCKGGSSEEWNLSVFIRMDGVNTTWNCFRSTCGWKGYVQPDGFPKLSQAKHDTECETDQDGKPNVAINKVYRKICEQDLHLEPLCNELVTYFSERMISAETLLRNSVMQCNRNNKIVIVFTYKRDGVLVGCKYREVSKKFLQVEGEIDKLSMEESGYHNCVSVPDGAPPRVSSKLPDKDQDKKYQFLWNCKDYLDSASRIILATDADPPGQALAEELARRRLGKERCWRVNWPKKNEKEVCKDANEVLMFLGPQALKRVIEDLFPDIDNYYLGIRGDEIGVHTGWKSMDELYKVVPAELTVVAGVPKSGKNEWIDALMCNINDQVGWKFVLCSMENKVREHARKLLEKHIKRPFFNARYGGSAERMSSDKFEEGKQWMYETFHLIRCEDDCLPSINWVLDLAKAAVLRYGVCGLVIDPYNELDHQQPSNQTETEYVSQILPKIKRFGQHYSCHVWLVAHPRQVCVRKARNKVTGQIGDAFLAYDRQPAGTLEQKAVLWLAMPSGTAHCPSGMGQCILCPPTSVAAAMAVEVVVSDGAAAAEVVAPAREVSGKAAEAVSPAAVVSKNGSFREESNFLGDLKGSEKKALAELRAKVEEAIVEGKLFDDGKVNTKKKVAEENAEEGTVTEKKEEEQGEEEPKREEADEGEKAAAAEEKPAEAAAAAAAVEKPAEEAAAVVVDKDIALWGVPLLPSKGDDATDVVLLKFLRARDFKAGAAFDMLRKTLHWRREWKGFGDGDVGEELPTELANAFYLDGTDREGHPVCYNEIGVFADDAVYKKALGTEEGKARFLRWRVRAMESDVAKLDFKPGGVASLLQVTDIKNSPGLAKKDLRVAMYQVLDLFQDNYPELVARNILINVPFWYYAFSALFYPFMTERTKSKFVIARPSKVTETLLKYIPIESIPVKYGGLKRDGDNEFSAEDSEVTELIVKANSTESIEIEATEGDTTLTWDLTVMGWEVNYKEEFVPTDEGSYSIIVMKGKKMGSTEAAVRNSFRASEPGKVVLTVENLSNRKKKVLFRHKARSACAKKC
ncbi:hypothetical protein ABZP36_020967 [Zizania latifolia]